MIHLRILLTLFVTISILACETSKSSSASKDHAHTNHLINESSPYLLQHAHNPVNWYPWGEEALTKAKKENKMLLISVGYASCHWCHVMEHESFEDSTVAAVMNENFVCIKVDREERPDVDDVYMTACHLSNQRSCGWPLNAFALPNGKPFFAGTYFPKNQWLNIIKEIKGAYDSDRDKLVKSAEQLTKGIQSSQQIVENTEEAIFKQEDLTKIFEKFIGQIDLVKGGKKGSPKFPMPNNYQFLLQYYHQSQQPKALKAVEVTLDNIANGGIYDHVGGGFARYSTDANWKVPHFEKMLYDNGQLVSLYSQAYQQTKKELYKRRVYETLEWVSREMTAANGGFYSSQDADSEGEEGKFYIWTSKELDKILGDDADLFKAYYQVSPSGNWEKGHNILFVSKSSKNVGQKYNLTPDALHKKLKKLKTKVLKARSKRVYPGKDDKILTSWNALMLKGYVDAYRAFGEPDFLRIALKNANFLVKHAIKDEAFRMNRNFKDGNSVINAFLDDYALTIDAFIALYQATFDEEWLNKAKKLADYTLNNFKDSNSAMFFYKSQSDKALIAKKTVISDNVIPASNSVMAKNLFLLGTFLDNKAYKEQSISMLNNMITSLRTENQPSFYSNWCSLLNYVVNPPFEVAIIGNNFEMKRKEWDEDYHPNALLLGGKTEGNLALLENKLNPGETTIYVCQNKVCKFPVQEVKEAVKLMK